MLVEAQLNINGTGHAVWRAASDIENAAAIISGIKSIEVVERPAAGMAESSAGVTVTSSHDSQPQTFKAKLQSIPMGQWSAHDHS